MKETIVHLTQRVKFPLAIAACSLLVLFVARPLLHMDNTPGKAGSSSKSVVSFTQKHATIIPNANLANLVDTFTGVGKRTGLSGSYGEGETFPGAAFPFGMVQWSPDSVRPTSTGYNYLDDRIRGFSLTHLSGAGCSDYGDVPFMPYTSPSTAALTTDFTHYSSTFAHTDELAHAGYYRVRLANGVMTELTATQHSGAGRFTYPTGQAAAMLVNLGGSLHKTSDAQAQIGSDTISGWASSGDFCGTHKNTYRVYFWAQFSQPFASSGTWHNGAMALKQSQVAGNDAAVFVTFDTRQQPVITMRVGV